MKKSFGLLLLLMLSVAMILCFSACAPDEPPIEEPPVGEEQPEEQPALKPIHFRFPGSSSGGSFYLQSTALAGLIEQLDFALSCTVEATTGGNENLILVNNDEGELALCNTHVAYHAANAMEPFEEAYDSFRSICMAAGSQIHIIVRANSGIETLSDLKGKSISPGTAGSGTELHFRYILDAVGISYDDLGRIDYLSFAETVQQLQDGKIDAGVLATAYPASQVMELALQTNIDLVAISDDEVAKVFNKVGWPVVDTIPGGTYSGIDEDKQVLTVPALLIVRDDLPDAWVYEITKVIHENIEELSATQVTFNAWDMSGAVDSFVPLHPGAKQYWEEQGLM